MRVNEITDKQRNLAIAAGALLKNRNGEEYIDWEAVRKFQNNNTKANSKSKSEYTEANGYFSNYDKLKDTFKKKTGKSRIDHSDYVAVQKDGVVYYKLKKTIEAK